MSDWLDSSDNANCFKQTYVQGFLDISGGSIISRGTEHGLVIGGDSSLNGTVYLGDSIFVRSDGLVAPPVFVDASYADVSGGAFIGDVISYDISGGPNVAGSTVVGVSLATDASWSQLGFDIDGEAAGDESARSVSMINSATYGRVVAIGAINNDGTTTSTSDNHGHVRVYQYRTIVESDWTNYNITDASYNGIAPTNKPIVVGASGDATPVSGKKYWVQMGGDIDGEAAGDTSGFSVSLVDASGGVVVAIGAINNDGTPNTLSNRGHVRVYQYIGSAWSQLGGDIDGEAENDQSGGSVSLVDASGGLVVAIGANLNDAGNATDDNRGHVRVYQYTGSAWSQLGADIDGQVAGDRSGWSVSLVDSAIGLVVAIGAILNDAGNATTDNRGHVRVYRYTGSAWSQLGGDIDGEAAGDFSGRSVSLIDSSIGIVVAIGANFNDGTAVSTNTSDNRGHVRVYQYDANKNEAIITDGSANFGPVGWRRLGADIDGEAGGDQSGFSVSLVDSSIGLVVAIGANQNDAGNGTSDNRGHVRVYQYDASKNDSITDQTSPDYGPIGWRRLGVDIDGEEVGDQSGWSVSLVDSADGLVVAIGAYFNDGTAAIPSRTFKVRSDGDSYTIDGFAGNLPVLTLMANTTYYFDVSEVSSSHPFALRNSSGVTTNVAGTTNNNPTAGVHQGSPNTIITYTRTSAGTIVYQNVNNSSRIGTINIIADDIRGHVRVYEIPYTNVYSDVSGGFFDVQVASNGATPFYVDASYVGQPGVVGVAKPDIPGGPDVAGSTVLSSSLSSDASWSQLGFDIDGEFAGDTSGRSVSLINSAIYGRVVAIGANNNDSTTTNTSDNRGHVRVYQYRTIAESDWTNYNITDASYNGIAPYDKPIVVGASGDATPVSGKKYWVQMGGDIDGEAAGDTSGQSVSLADASGGLVVAIGATLNLSTGVNAGHVRVYQYAANKTSPETDQNQPDFGPVGWNRLGGDIDGEAAGDNSGWSVSLVDSSIGIVVAIGAVSNASSRGQVRVYQYTGSAWSKLGANIDGQAAGDRSGESVSLIDSSIGLIVAIGAINNDAGNAVSDNRGHVRVYRYTGSTWSQMGGDMDGEAAVDQSGYSVSLVDSSIGLVVAIGAINNDAGNATTDNRGHVRVYQYDASKNNLITDQNSLDFGPIGWRRLGADIDGEAAGDSSGFSVSLVDSSIGLVVAIGADRNAGNGSLSGHVHVYQYDASKNEAILTDGSANFGPVGWNRLGADIDGEEVGDRSGRSVSLVDSADGLVVAIGAINNDGTAVSTNTSDNRGHVRVYEIPYTNVYSDVSNGFFDVQVIGGYLNDGLTPAALYVNGDTDLSGGLTVRGDVSFNAGNLFVAGDLSINGILSVSAFAPNSIGADAIDSTVDIEFANKLAISVADLSFNTTGIQVATDFSLNNTPIALDANLTVPANIAIVDGSNGTVYGSYLTLTNKAATAYYNVGKSASGLFNIVDQANAGVYLTAGGTSFTGTSDARLKTNITPLESATDKIMALNPCTYQWKSDIENKTNEKTSTKTHIGFIAQEVEQVMPELVHPIDHPAGPDYKGVNTTDLIPYLVRTLQEQKELIESLYHEISALEASEP